MTWIEKRRVWTKGASEIFVKWYLVILRELKYNLHVKVSFVSLGKNRVDAFTKVRNTWVRVPADTDKKSLYYVWCRRQQFENITQNIAYGCIKTQLLARKVNTFFSKEAVQKVVRECQQSLHWVCIKLMKSRLRAIGRDWLLMLFTFRKGCTC